LSVIDSTYLLGLAVINAWGTQYVGHADKILLQAVDAINRLPVENHYAKIIPVAQSSGTGKSRTVDKIATERILFPLCLRENLRSTHFGV